MSKVWDEIFERLRPLDERIKPESGWADQVKSERAVDVLLDSNPSATLSQAIDTGKAWGFVRLTGDLSYPDGGYKLPTTRRIIGFCVTRITNGFFVCLHIPGQMIRFYGASMSEVSVGTDLSHVSAEAIVVYA